MIFRETFQPWKKFDVFSCAVKEVSNVKESIRQLSHTDGELVPRIVVDEAGEGTLNIRDDEMVVSPGRMRSEVTWSPKSRIRSCFLLACCPEQRTNGDTTSLGPGGWKELNGGRLKRRCSDVGKRLMVTRRWVK